MKNYVFIPLALASLSILFLESSYVSTERKLSSTIKDNTSYNDIVNNEPIIEDNYYNQNISTSILEDLTGSRSNNNHNIVDVTTNNNTRWQTTLYVEVEPQIPPSDLATILLIYLQASLGIKDISLEIIRILDDHYEYQLIVFSNNDIEKVDIVLHDKDALRSFLLTYDIFVTRFQTENDLLNENNNKNNNRDDKDYENEQTNLIIMITLLVSSFLFFCIVLMVLFILPKYREHVASKQAWLYSQEKENSLYVHTSGPTPISSGSTDDDTVMDASANNNKKTTAQGTSVVIARHHCTNKRSEEEQQYNITNENEVVQECNERSVKQICNNETSEEQHQCNNETIREEEEKEIANRV